VRALKILLLVPMLAACPSTGSSDGGAADAAIDGPLACQPDAGPPLDAGDASPIKAMQDTHAPFQNACSAQQISDYVQCQGPSKVTDLCTQFKPGNPGEACGKCIETPYAADAGPWGVIVFNGSTAFLNVEGCVNVALGTFDCGSALHSLYQCEEIVCSACTGNDFTTCELESAEDPNYCGTLSDAVTSSTGACAAINGDAGLPCAVQPCFPNTAIQDSTSQQTDWLTRIVTYMCGPVPEGGPSACP
jgi:hypothetical protein